MLWSWQWLDWTETQAVTLKLWIIQRGKKSGGTNCLYIPQTLTSFSISYQKTALPSSKSVPSRKPLKVPASHNPIVHSFVEHSTSHNPPCIFVTSAYVCLLHDKKPSEEGMFYIFYTLSFTLERCLANVCWIKVGEDKKCARKLIRRGEQF